MTCFMKQITQNILVIITLIFTVFSFTHTAQAATCAEIANRTAKEIGATVIGAQSISNGCRVKLRLPAKNGKQSRIVTRTLSN